MVPEMCTERLDILPKNWSCRFKTLLRQGSTIRAAYRSLLVLVKIQGRTCVMKKWQRQMSGQSVADREPRRNGLVLTRALRLLGDRTGRDSNFRGRLAVLLAVAESDFAQSTDEGELK